ncbi:MAG: DUF502 domain-containing protein [Bacteroidia bacterium]|nr:DUF502 domain-containing protein [Bacteroidia bacterium]MCX7763558.1 DUF502 domain-containing protein [Bacteroidia bacterium]MDW8057892.1 DUF502 domain-containing protein [Bacteroidia bacterium]
MSNARVSDLLRQALRVLIGYFLRGVFLFLPALATVYVLWLILDWLDNILPIGLPGLGILLLLVSITVLGYIGTHWLGPTLIASMEARIQKIPFIGFLYGTVRELVNTSRRSYRFEQPVLFRLNPHTQIYRIGFLTHESPLPGYDFVAVFAPFSFATLTGETLFLPRELVIPLPMRGVDALRLVLSGAFVTGQSESNEHS